MSLWELWGFASCAIASQSRGILEEAAFQQGLKKKKKKGPKWIRKELLVGSHKPSNPNQPQPLPCFPRELTGHGHRTSKAACHPVGLLPLHHLTLTRQDSGCEGPLCTQSSRQPGLPPEQPPQPGAWIPEWLCPLHPGQPCSRSHAPDTDPSGLDDPSATPRTQGLSTVGTGWEILTKNLLDR